MYASAVPARGMRSANGLKPASSVKLRFSKQSMSVDLLGVSVTSWLFFVPQLFVRPLSDKKIEGQKIHYLRGAGCFIDSQAPFCWLLATHC